jgi:hypothetical protein
MAVGPEQQSQQTHRPQEHGADSLPQTPGPLEAGQFGDALRQYFLVEGESVSFEPAHGHEDWHRSLQYPA